MARGQQVHEAAQQYVEAKRAPRLHPDLDKFKQKLAALRKCGTLCEQDWAFTKDWQRTSWFGADAWLRIKMDAHYLLQQGPAKRKLTTVYVIDYKTGRVHEEHAEQRSLYALGALLMYPDAARVVTEHWYLDSGEVGRDEFAGDSFESLRKAWLKKTKPMLSDKRFAPRPGPYCRWCFYSKAKNGLCRF
jgi:hypothetical protein